MSRRFLHLDFLRLDRSRAIQLIVLVSFVVGLMVAGELTAPSARGVEESGAATAELDD